MFELYIERPVATDFLTTLTQALKSPNLSPLVLHIWGVGGVGKSTLARRARDGNPQAVSAYIEFGRTEGSDDTIGLLKALHQDLSREFKGQPDPFGKRYSDYFDTMHKLKTESEDGKGAASPEQIETVKKGVVWVAKGLGSLTPIGSEAAGMVAEGVVEGAKLALSEKDRLVDLVQRHRATRGKRELQELILNPVPRLTDAFVESLTLWSRRQPILLILDTYEKVPAEIDSWIWATLLGNHDELHPLPVRLLLMGRHEILRNEGWRKLNQDRPGWIYERSLQKLDREQTQDYLQRIGITDTTQIERIYKVTKGLPYYLNWIRDKQQKGEPLEFVEGNEAIARLLLQGLDAAKQQMIELAACCRWFDQRLLESLGQQHGLTIDFAWLTQQSFVERINENYRLDDVARDVFRQEFCRRSPQAFERVFDLLMRYFKALSDQKVDATSPPPDKYENDEWRKLRTEYLYYLLFTNKSDLQTIWIAHLLEARYLRQDSLVQVPLQAIDSETTDSRHPHLSTATAQWLQQLRPAVKRGWAVLEEDPIDYPYNQEQFSLTPAATQTAIVLCLNQTDSLHGLAKFAALFYRSRRCPEPEKLNWLKLAEAEAEKIAAPTHPEFSSNLFLYSIGNSLYDLGRKEEAISSYDKAIECKPDYHKAWNNRGNALSALGRKEEAISSYDKAIECKPDYHEAWNNRGNALSDLGRKEEAISSYDKAIECKPDYHEAWYNRGVALSDLGRKEEAISSYDKAIECKPDYHEAWNNRGVALSDLGRKEEAISSYDKAIECKPDYHEAWYNRGVALSDLGRKEDAISSYDKAIEFKPNYYRAWDNRGDVLVDLKRYAEAIDSYDQAIVIQPDYRWPHKSRGIALMCLERYEEALTSFERAIALKPDWARAYYDKACCHALQGDVIEAVDCLSRAIALDPEYRELAKTDTDFDAIRGEDWFRAVVEG